MKRMGILAVCLAAVFLLSACAGDAEPVASSWADEVGNDTGPGLSQNMTEAAAPTENQSEQGSASETGGGIPYQAAGVKLIYRASVAAEAVDFDSAAASLESLVEELGGYFESSSVWYGGWYADEGTGKEGQYTVRVPADQYEEFLSRLSDDPACHVTRVTRSTEDVGQDYYDIESRLKTQQIKRDRIQELLSRAQEMEDIIALENALSEVELEIEQLTGDMNRYDALIGYAAIELSLLQVVRLSDVPAQQEGLGARIARGFRSGAANFTQGLGDFLVWCSYHLLEIVLVLVIALAVAVPVVRGILRKRRRKAAAAPTEPGSREEEKKD